MATALGHYWWHSGQIPFLSNDLYSLGNVYGLYNCNTRIIKYCKETIPYLASKIWSIVPQTIKESTSIYSLKTKTRKLKIENKEIIYQKTIREKFNEFYVNAGPNFASKIPQNNNDYKSYLPDITTIFDEQDLTGQDLEEAVASLKPNKSPG